MADPLQTDIKFLTGVGPKRADLLNRELNIHTFEDLLYHFPYRYIDRSRFYKISEINSQLPYIQIRGRISSMEVTGPRYKKRLVAEFFDDTGSIELVWFQGVSWIRETLKKDREYVAEFSSRGGVSVQEKGLALPIVTANFENVISEEIISPLINEVCEKIEDRQDERPSLQ